MQRLPGPVSLSLFQLGPDPETRHFPCSVNSRQSPKQLANCSRANPHNLNLRLPPAAVKIKPHFPGPPCLAETSSRSVGRERLPSVLPTINPSMRSTIASAQLSQDCSSPAVAAAGIPLASLHNRKPGADIGIIRPLTVADVTDFLGCKASAQCPNESSSCKP